jgi:hypothetical protein
VLSAAGKTGHHFLLNLSTNPMVLSTCRGAFGKAWSEVVVNGGARGFILVASELKPGGAINVQSVNRSTRVRLVLVVLNQIKVH